MHFYLFQPDQGRNCETRNVTAVLYPDMDYPDFPFHVDQIKFFKKVFGGYMSFFGGGGGTGTPVLDFW